MVKNDKKKYKGNKRQKLHQFEQESFRTRCSPSHFVNVTQEFSEAQKMWVSSIGFNGLIQLQQMDIQRDLCEWLVSCFNVKYCRLELSVGRKLNIRESDVHAIFGLPYIGTSVEIRGARDMTDITSLQALERRLIEEVNEVHFQKLFVVYACTTVLAPDARVEGSHELWHYVLAQPSAPSVNWCQFVVRYLQEGIKDFRRKGTLYLRDSCVFLQLHYLTATYLTSIEVPRTVRLCAAWSGSLIRRRVSSELDSFDRFGEVEFVEVRNDAPIEPRSSNVAHPATLNKEYLLSRLRAAEMKISSAQQEIAEIMTLITTAPNIGGNVDPGQHEAAAHTTPTRTAISKSPHIHTNSLEPAANVDTPFYANCGSKGCSSNLDIDGGPRSGSIPTREYLHATTPHHTTTTIISLAPTSYRYLKSHKEKFDALHSNSHKDDGDRNVLTSVIAQEINNREGGNTRSLQSNDGKSRVTRLRSRSAVCKSPWIQQCMIKFDRITEDDRHIAETALHDCDESEILCQMHGYYLSRRDFKCWSGTNWLSTTVINMYCRVLSTEAVANKESRHFIIPEFSDSLIQICEVKKPSSIKLIKLAEDYCAQSVAPVRIIGVDELFLPVLTENHWILVIVSFNLGCVTILNSLNRRRNARYTSAARKIAQGLQVICTHIGMKLAKEIPSMDIIHADVTKQDNSYDCGVFVLEYMKRWRHGGIEK